MTRRGTAEHDSESPGLREREPERERESFIRNYPRALTVTGLSSATFK
jgi:hypothetical protein